MINQITKNIAIGEYQDAMNEEALKHYQIDCILNVNEIELKNNLDYEKLDIYYWWHPIPRDRKTQTMETFKKDILTASYEVKYLTERYMRILVHCLSGIDRAPLVVARYLEIVAGITIPQAYSLIKQQRKHIMEHYEWI